MNTYNYTEKRTQTNTINQINNVKINFKSIQFKEINRLRKMTFKNSVKYFVARFGR